MTIFDQDVSLDHLPQDTRELYGILIELDKVLHKEDALLSEERAALEGHKELLSTFKKRSEDETVLLLISSMESLSLELSKVHERFTWAEKQIEGFEQELTTESVVEWKPRPLLDFLNKLEEQMQLEEAEIFDEELLMERFEDVVEHEAQPLSADEQAELDSVLDFLVEHAKRVFRLQKLLLDTIALLQD